MNRCPFAARVLHLGLFTAQVIAFIQVYLSNADLYRTLIAIIDAGYLAIPNYWTMHSLKEFGPALYGGLFFTLSVGASITLFFLAAAWVWDRLFFRNKFLLILFFMLWIGTLLIVNIRGFSPLVTLYFLVIPPVVFVAASRWMPSQAMQRVWINRMVHGIPVLLLAVLWFTQMDSHMFEERKKILSHLEEAFITLILDLRDNLLLSNSLGRKINRFYYNYTLYPAQAFKSLDQKTLRTCNLASIQNNSYIRPLEKKLLDHDYLNVGGDPAADLKISQRGKDLVFENRGRVILETLPMDFFSNPGAVLKEFSFKSDQYAFFRKFTFFSILIGFPVALYILIYALFRFLAGFFVDSRASSLIASILCFLIGVTLLVIFQNNREKEIEVKEVAEALQSERWQKRVAALRIIQKKGIEVADFQAYQKMLASPHIPERYWLVRALGVSRKSETYTDLLAFLDDPHPNVVCMAFYALGQRGDRRAVKEIIQRIRTSSDDWYNQWYAYRALRSLGWKQTRSRQKP